MSFLIVRALKWRKVPICALEFETQARA